MAAFWAAILPPVFWIVIGTSIGAFFVAAVVIGQRADDVR